MGCPIERQCDEYAKALGAEDARADAIERFADDVNDDYGDRLQELSDAIRRRGDDRELRQAISRGEPTEDIIHGLICELRAARAGPIGGPSAVMAGCVEALRPTG